MRWLAAALLATAALAPVALPAAPRTGFYGCRGFAVKQPAALVRPTSIVLACGDGNFYVTGVRWSSWTATAAAGTGTAHQNDCDPYCAAGHFHVYPVTIALAKAKTCKGSRVFTRISWRFTVAKPAGVNRSDRLDFPC